VEGAVKEPQESVDLTNHSLIIGKENDQTFEKSRMNTNFSV